MVDWRPYLEAAREAAWHAGTMLRRNLDEANTVFFKGEVDLVTNCDHAAQKIIFDYLVGLFPDHDFLAEEGLSLEKGSPFQWIIDPLDGTTNFAHRFPIFCVSIALRHEEDIAIGVVYDPTREETFWAVRAEGSFLNGRRLAVSETDQLSHSLLATGFPYDIRQTGDNIGHFTDFVTRAQAVRRCGSAALDLCYVASGRFDGFWEKKLNPWDVAAGALVVREAGGRTTDFQGSPMRTTFRDVLASNGRIHEQMLDILRLDLKRGGKHEGT